MKKLLAILLAVTTVFSTTSLTAFADDIVGSDELMKDKDPTEIISTIDTPGSNPWEDTNWDDTNTKLCVNVKWSDTEFTYTFGDEWNAQDHKYVHSDNHDKEDGWNRDFITIDVENLSNCPVLVEIADINTIDDDVKIQFDKNRKTKNLTSALRPANVEDKRNQYQFIMNFEYTPKEYAETFKKLINFTVKLSQSTGEDVCEHKFVPSHEKYANGDYHVYYYGEKDYYDDYYHECIYCGLLEPHTPSDRAFDNFGRFVLHCTVCDAQDITHIDWDEDGLCDDCGREVDFCPECCICHKYY